MAEEVELAFWSKAVNWLNNTPNTAGIVPNDNPDSSVGSIHNPGDPDGLELVGFDSAVENRGLSFATPSPWDGWPGSWSTPDFQTTQKGIQRLIDIAWACIDLNSNVISAMPVYRTAGGVIVDPTTWMANPDPTIYSSWQEFAKQLFWDFQLGEAFVMPMVMGSDNYPLRFRVVPPYLVNVELSGGGRAYSIGGRDVTDRILHIRYHSSTTDARGHGPLEAAGARMVAIGLLQRYANNIAETGGIPLYWMEIARKINQSEGQDLIDRWVETRVKNAGHPAIVSGDAKLHQANSMNPKDMALMELSSFNEARIAVMLGVPPFLVSLTSGGGSHSLTYSNISDLFDYHDRSGLRPRVRMVMEGISFWGLPSGQALELNRDDYTRLQLDKRYAAYKIAIDTGFLDIEEVRDMERLGPMSQSLIDLRNAKLAALQQPPNSFGSSGQSSPPKQAPAKSSTSNGKPSTLAAKALSGGAD